MKRIIAILLPVGSSPFSETPLLGKPSRAYVEQALTDAGITLAATVPQNADSLRPLLADDVSVALLVRPDTPCLTADTFAALAAAAKTRPAAVLMADMRTPLAMGFPAATLRKLPAATPFELPAVVAWLDEQSTAVKVISDVDPGACLIVRDTAGFAAAFRTLRGAIVRRHLQGGVVVLEPDRTVIEADVRIGAGTVVYGGNTLQGMTVIGEGCTLYPNSRFDSAIVGDGVTVESSVLVRCRVGARTTVGPFAYLRPDAVVGEHCRIGDFVEIKNSSIGDGTKVSHLTYVGDSDLGKDINLGCGVVFVNYDGKTKNRSQVDDHAFIGCNCNLIAPVHVGENAYLAAGSTVVEDVPADALFVARSRGVVKEDWVKRRKEQGKL